MYLYRKLQEERDKLTKEAKYGLPQKTFLAQLRG